MRLDVVKVGRILESGIVPVQVLHPPIDIRVVMLFVTHTQGEFIIVQ